MVILIHFMGADQDAGSTIFWIVKQAIQWEKFGYTPGKFKMISNDMGYGM
jgi:hypothetical protein